MNFKNRLFNMLNNKQASSRKRSKYANDQFKGQPATLVDGSQGTIKNVLTDDAGNTTYEVDVNGKTEVYGGDEVKIAKSKNQFRRKANVNLPSFDEIKELLGRNFHVFHDESKNDELLQHLKDFSLAEYGDEKFVFLSKLRPGYNYVLVHPSKYDEAKRKGGMSGSINNMMDKVTNV